LHGRRCRASSIQDVARETHLNWKTVKALEMQYMREQLRRAGTPGPRVIGLDEVSIRKGHTYRIIASDLVRRRPIWFGGTDRSEASLDEFFAWLGPRKSARIQLAVMAKRLGRAPSSISREIRRNGGPGKYRAQATDIEAWDRARRPKTCRLAMHPELMSLVWRKLRDDWSPEQIARWLVKTYPDDPSLHVSHETIYRTLYVQTRGELRKELTAHLRRSYGVRQSVRAKRTGRGRGQIMGAVSISERPAEVADRAVPGHWEGDLLGRGTSSRTLPLSSSGSRAT
jgi:hypothetical protein